MRPMPVLAPRDKKRHQRQQADRFGPGIAVYPVVTLSQAM